MFLVKAKTRQQASLKEQMTKQLKKRQKVQPELSVQPAMLEFQTILVRKILKN